MTRKLGETLAEALLELTQRGYRIEFDAVPEIGPCIRVVLSRGDAHYARVVTSQELHLAWMGADQLLNMTLDMAYRDFVFQHEQPGPPKEPQ